MVDELYLRLNIKERNGIAKIRIFETDRQTDSQTLQTAARHFLIYFQHFSQPKCLNLTFPER
jgi:hypothetical protein